MQRYLSNKLLWAVIILLGLLIVLVLALLITNRQAASQGTSVTAGEQPELMQLLDPDDPDNPYRGQYTAYDYWVFEHVVIPGTEEQEKHPSEMTPEEIRAQFAKTNKPANWMDTGATVYEGKYLVPFQVAIRDHHEALKNHTTDTRAQKTTAVRVKGVLDPELKATFRKQANRIDAGFYPPIPTWLAENPPRQAMLLPNGYILTQGLLGAWAETAGKGFGVEEEYEIAHGYYDLDGNLIREQQHGWLGLADGTTKEQQPPGHAIWIRDGYWKFIDDGTGALIAIWDYDGTPLASEEDAVPRDPHNFTWLSGLQIMDYYEAMHE